MDKTWTHSKRAISLSYANFYTLKSKFTSNVVEEKYSQIPLHILDSITIRVSQFQYIVVESLDTDVFKLLMMDL